MLPSLPPKDLVLRILILTLPVPIENGFGLDNHQSRLPMLPHFPQADPKQTIGSDLGTANRSLEDCHLLPQRKIFQSDLFRTSQDHEGHAKKTENCIEHECRRLPRGFGIENASTRADFLFHVTDRD